jgi:hypothetical protein
MLLRWCIVGGFAWGWGSYTFGQDTNSAVEAFTLTPHRYEISLSADEFSVLHSAAQSGIANYGGDADFRVRISRVGTDVAWLVTITNPRLIEVWRLWMSEKTAQLLGAVDVDGLDDMSKRALRATQLVNAKLVHAASNPIWDPITVIGAVTEDSGSLYIEAPDARYSISGERTLPLAAMKDRVVVARGFNKAAGQLEVTAFAEQQSNTLEVFVMSHCPFAQHALVEIIEYLERSAEINGPPVGEPHPRLVVRYILYKQREGERLLYTSMHGTPEIEEDLVQMVIRDSFPEHFESYLLKRAEVGQGKDWRQVLLDVGLEVPAIESIETLIAESREDLIAKEYDYVAGTLGVYDGSPTYFWEGRPTPDIRKIPVFSSMQVSSFLKCEDH